MDKQQILNKTITIQGVTMKETKSGQKYSLRDHEGRTFNFFTTKQDGTDTSAFAQFKNMGLKMGDSVMIGYVEDEFQMDGKTVISKKIISFRETNDLPTQTSARQESSTSGANTGQSGGSDDRFWDKKALKQCIWNYWLEVKAKKGIDELTEAEMNMVAATFNLIEAYADKRFNPSPLRQAVGRHAPSLLEEELPVIQQEEVNVDGIPF